MGFDDAEGEGGGDYTQVVPPEREIPHYHGDRTRVFFVAAAIVLIVAESTGAQLPLSPGGAVIAAVLLVVAAGITNPAQPGIHWLNAVLAVLGTLLFGTSAVQHYRAGSSVLEPAFVFIETLAILFLIALYFTTRTIRGIHVNRRP